MEAAAPSPNSPSPAPGPRSEFCPFLPIPQQYLVLLCLAQLADRPPPPAPRTDEHVGTLPSLPPLHPTHSPPAHPGLQYSAGSSWEVWIHRCGYSWGTMVGTGQGGGRSAKLEAPRLGVGSVGEGSRAKAGGGGGRGGGDEQGGQGAAQERDLGGWAAWRPGDSPPPPRK